MGTNGARQTGKKLAVGTPQRMSAVPQLPTLVEMGFKDIHISSWFAAMVPTGTPRPVIDQINKWFNEVGSTEEAGPASDA